MQRREFIEVTAGVLAGALAAKAGTAAETAATPTLLQRVIPSSGESIPVIGLGTSGPFEVGVDPQQRAPLSAVLEAFFAGGGTFIDTSPMYSTAEAVLGDLLTPAMQERAFVATKVWTRGEQEGVRQMTRSRELLRRRKIDLMQVHNLLDLEVHLRTLRRWKAEGRIRYIGITHYTVASQEALAEIIRREPIDFVQFNYSATTTAAEHTLLPLCADRGVATIVNRAFDDGKIFAQLRGKPLPSWAADIGCSSWAQVLLKYVISHPAVTCVIPATGKMANMQDNLAAGRGALPDAQLRRTIAATVQQV
ncbi:MAG: aldo/keto reductase [Sinobacteraceae bacterium]|nr:aldo/keto reductase [Nevskiaceae bacterium]